MTIKYIRIAKDASDEASFVSNAKVYYQKKRRTYKLPTSHKLFMDIVKEASYFFEKADWGVFSRHLASISEEDSAWRGLCGAFYRTVRERWK